jgi:hypothetical protein
MGSVNDIFLRATYSALLHGTFNGMMSGIQGGKFWSGFASGALSSIASSLWSGGGTKTEEGFFKENNWAHGTREVAREGIGGALGLNNTAGMIAFGTIMGGVGAELTGGNFWQGAATGLMVSGLSHLGNKMTVRAAAKSGNANNQNSESGNKINWFDKNDDENYALWDYANDDTNLPANTVKVYSHGSTNGSINGITNTKVFSSALSKLSPLWKEYINSGMTKSLTLELKACFSCGFANRLVADGFKNLTIICKPINSYYEVNYFFSQRLTSQPVQTWTKYMNGYNYGNFNK